MKTFIVISDSHGNLSAIERLYGIMQESDYVVHLGDYCSDMREYSEPLCEKLYCVKGNCDGGGEDFLLQVDGKKILLTHGDRYGVKSGLYKLLLRAKEVQADAVLYGHTHIAEITEIEGITFIIRGVYLLTETPVIAIWCW